MVLLVGCDLRWAYLLGLVVDNDQVTSGLWQRKVFALYHPKKLGSSHKEKPKTSTRHQSRHTSLPARAASPGMQ